MVPLRWIRRAAALRDYLKILPANLALIWRWNQPVLLHNKNIAGVGAVIMKELYQETVAESIRAGDPS